MDQQNSGDSAKSNDGQDSSTFGVQSHPSSPSGTGRHADSVEGVSGQEFARRRPSISQSQPVSRKRTRDQTNDHVDLHVEIAVLKGKLEQMELERVLATDAYEREKNETERLREIQKEQEQELGRLSAVEKENETLKEFQARVYATGEKVKEVFDTLRKELAKTKRPSDE